MPLATLIQTIGSVGFFANRAFTPAFITALLIRYGQHLPVVGDTAFVQSVTGVPTWFTHDLTLVVLGVLATLEVLATKNADARELLNEADAYLKSGMSLVTTLGVISAADAATVRQIIEPNAYLAEPAMSAGVLTYPLAVVTAAGTYFLASARSQVVSLFSDADEDDESGVQQLMSWAEDVWVFGGLLFLIVFPVVMLILIGIVSGLIVAARKYVERREENSKIACTGCGMLIYPCATACPGCKTPIARPCDVGFLGGSKRDRPITDVVRHQYRLVEKKRCPVCATRLTQRLPRQHCDACGHDLMSEPAFADGYLNHIAGRLPAVCGVSFLLSLIPVIGLIPGVIYYRIALVAPLSRYLPFGRRFFLKWGMRALFFVLIAFQWVPLLGGIVVPLMAAMSYAVYRNSYASLLADTVQTPATSPAAEST